MGTCDVLEVIQIVRAFILYHSYHFITDKGRLIPYTVLKGTVLCENILKQNTLRRTETTLIFNPLKGMDERLCHFIRPFSVNF